MDSCSNFNLNSNFINIFTLYEDKLKKLDTLLLKIKEKFLIYDYQARIKLRRFNSLYKKADKIALEIKLLRDKIEEEIDKKAQ